MQAPCRAMAAELIAWQQQATLVCHSSIVSYMQCILQGLESGLEGQPIINTGF
jgi:hypothetical protein